MNSRILCVIFTSFCKKSQEEDFNIIDHNSNDTLKENSIRRSYACGPKGCSGGSSQKSNPSCGSGSGSPKKGSCGQDRKTSSGSCGQDRKTSSGSCGQDRKPSGGSFGQDRKPSGGSCGQDRKPTTESDANSKSNKKSNGSQSCCSSDCCPPKKPSQLLESCLSENKNNLASNSNGSFKNKELHEKNGEVYDCTSGECKKIGVLKEKKPEGVEKSNKNEKNE